MRTLLLLSFALACMPCVAQEQDEPQASLPEVQVVAPETSAPSAGSTDSNNTAPFPVPAQDASSSSGAGASASNLAPGTITSDTRSPRAGNEVASSLTVITREAIRNSGQTQLSELLRLTPGLDVVQAGGAGQQTSVFLRGANSNQVKVLIDGVPANDPGSPGRAFDFSFMTTEQIQRIEVLRGPQSTLYGSDAIGGVINIITEPGTGPPSVTLGGLGGRYGTGQARAATSGGDEEFHYSFGALYYDTDGFSAASIPPGNQEADGYRNGTYSGRIGWKPSDEWKIDATLRFTDTDTETDEFGFIPPFGFIPQDSPARLLQQTTFGRLQATWVSPDGLLTSRVGGGYSQYERTNISAFGGEFYGRVGRFDWQNDLLLLDFDELRWVLTGGFDFVEELGRSAGVPRGRLNDPAEYVQTSLDLFDRWFTTAGARHDEYSQAGPADTWRVTSRFEIVPRSTTIHGAIGTGFRAPAIEELFNLPFGGNPNLLPEESKGWEAGLRQPLLDDLIVVDATYFRNDFDNLITFVFDPFAPFFGALENVSRARSSGVEVTSLWRLTDRTTSFLNYTLTETRDLETGLPLVRRPREKWQMGVNWTDRSQRWNLTTSAIYTGDRIDVGAIPLDSYWLVNVAANWQATRSWRWLARVDNLLDQSYEEIYGYQNPGVSLFAGGELTLR